MNKWNFLSPPHLLITWEGKHTDREGGRECERKTEREREGRREEGREEGGKESGRGVREGENINEYMELWKQTHQPPRARCWVVA